jgi:MtN3 and saliva related transmembrane protein
MLEILGMCAGACTTMSFVPQIKKVWETKSTKDISIHMYIIYSSGLLLWTIYGFLIGSISLILANFVTLIFALCILGMKLRWDDF